MTETEYVSAVVGFYLIDSIIIIIIVVNILLLFCGRESVDAKEM